MAKTMNEKTLSELIAREITLGVLALDEDLAVVYANPFFHKCFPKLGDIKGKDIRKIVSNDGLLVAFENYISRGTIDSDDIEVEEEGSVFKVSTVALPEEEGKGLLLFFQDITDEIRLGEIKRDFVANVSHELRTPLASIKGYSETLLDGSMDDKDTLKEFLAIIDRHATRMSRLIDDLLVLSRVESQQMSFNTESVDLTAVIKTTASGVEKQALDKGVAFTLELGSSDVVVSGDAYRLEQVLVNLFDNAIKYTPKGGSVRVTASEGAKSVEVRVSDTGLGIPEEDLPRIFERFYRVDKARSREMGGTGLGLSIVKHIVNSMHGTIGVESEVGKGTTFILKLAKELD